MSSPPSRPPDERNSPLGTKSLSEMVSWCSYTQPGTGGMKPSFKYPSHLCTNNNNNKNSKTKSTMQKCEKGLITKDTSDYHLGSFILCDVNVCKERLM